MFLLQDILVQEKTRNPPSAQPPLPPRPSFLQPSGSAGASSPPKDTSAQIPAYVKAKNTDIHYNLLFRGLKRMNITLWLAISLFFYTCRCFFDVTRREAEKMLEANPEYGGIILRPSTLPNNYALTLRQLTPRSDDTFEPLKWITPSYQSCIR